MIIVADAGGTTTNWRIATSSGIIQKKTSGFNAANGTLEDFRNSLSGLEAFEAAQQLYYYSAGFNGESTSENNLKNWLQEKFPSASISIQSDLIGAARGLLGDEKGHVGILGTGANVCNYDGKSVSRLIAPLGYILGDEGSGAYLGKMLLKEYLRGGLPVDVAEDFNKEYSLSEKDIVLEVYNGITPPKYLGNFSHFLSERLDNPYCSGLVRASFKEHFKVFYGEKSLHSRICYTGSVAYHFSNILRQVANECGKSIDRVVEDPVAGLALYHFSDKYFK